MLKGNQVATYAHGSKNAWQGWRVTGNLGFDVSRQTMLPNGESVNINSRLNKGGIPANILLQDLNKNFSTGKNPYARMLRNVGIKDRAMIENISSETINYFNDLLGENSEKMLLFLLGKNVEKLQGKTIAIVGLGGLGCTVANLLARLKINLILNI